MKERKLAILRDTETDWIRVYSPYSKGFVEWLKLNIPPSDREPVFHENNKGKKKFDCWRVRRIYLDDVVKLLTDFFDGEIESDLAEDEGTVFDQLFQVVPDGKVDKAFRLLGQLFHPDAGGDEGQFKKLQAAYEARKKQEGK